MKQLGSALLVTATVVITACAGIARDESSRHPSNDMNSGSAHALYTDTAGEVKTATGIWSSNSIYSAQQTFSVTLTYTDSDRAVLTHTETRTLTNTSTNTRSWTTTDTEMGDGEATYTYFNRHR